jgi:hypothetical protein
MLLKTEFFELVCSRTVREHRKLAVMALKMKPDGRKLRDAETVVDCAKAYALLQGSQISNIQDRAAQEIGITRSVLHRIIGKGVASY